MRAAAVVPLLGLCAGLAVGARGSRWGGPAEAAALATQLRALYEGPARGGERWGHRPRLVTLADGSQAPRESAYRDDPRFVEAARWLLDSGQGDDAALGAWLLGSTPPPRRADAERALIAALSHRDPLAVVEAARGLAGVGGPEARAALQKLAERAELEAVRGAAAWSADRLGPATSRAPRLAPGFRRGVCWWFEGQDRDQGRASFAALRSLGVDSISIHTWEPRQRSAHEPEFAEALPRWALPQLPALVARAHEAGLQVVYKPHLEMAHGWRSAEHEWHGAIEMRDEAGWRAWFANYEAYLLDHARRAQEAGADLFCVGREIDRTVLRREADWRRLIARVRSVYRGPLTYSAHHDTFDQLGFWDALDFVGVAAYFPLSAADHPTPAALDAGWAAVLPRLEAVARRTGRPLLLTEVGYPALPSAAREPWSETRAPADPWLQARCYEAALRASAGRPWLQGAFFWLWEGVSQPPFRDSSFTLQGKPASFVMAAYYR
jgi:Glycoside Hydrolase Family 113